LAEFHRFPELSAELRLKIWTIFMADDLLIEVEYGSDANYDEKDPEAWVSH
jgi:hypothetical protein